MIKVESSSAKKKLLKIRRFIPVYLLALPGLAYLFINNYMPMAGLVVAFKEYNVKKGIFFSEWAGLKNFKYLFGTDDVLVITRNTVLYNLGFIVTGTICSILVAIILHEMRGKAIKNVSQALILLPYLVSWVIGSYLVFAFLGYNGFVNNSILAPLGVNSISWYTIPKYWPVIIVLVNLWHNVGYWCIMYYATIVGIDPTYYEAADLDGASHWQKIIYITIPFLKVVTITIILLSLGRIFYSDFGLFYQIPMNSGALFPTTNVIDTYVYRGLLMEGNISMSSAACLYQSVVGFIIVLIANGVVRKIDPDSAFY